MYLTALDRLSRRVVDLTSLLSEFETAGATVHLAQQFQPPEGAQSRLLRHILGTFAEFERDMIATRIEETRTYLRQQGQRIAGPVPFGYEADPQTKQLVPVAQEARRVRLIFERAARGQTPSQIAARINHLKWRTKTWVAQRSGKTRGGGKWTARQVLYLLRNPVYIGEYRDDQGTRPGCHAPLVERDLFDRVQEMLDNRRTVTNATRRSQDFPLRGKLICPKCGRPLSTQINSRRFGRRSRVHYRFYCCRSSAGGRAPCKGVRYPACQLEGFVYQMLTDVAVWQGLLAPDHEVEAARYATVWSGLGRGLQDSLIGQMIDQVTFARNNTEMRITFTDRCCALISAELQGNQGTPVNHRVSDQADRF